MENLKTLWIPYSSFQTDDGKTVDAWTTEYIYLWSERDHKRLEIIFSKLWLDKIKKIKYRLLQEGLIATIDNLIVSSMDDWVTFTKERALDALFKG